MKQLSEQELIEVLREHFSEKKKAMKDLDALTRELERVNGRLLEAEALKSRFLSNVRNEFNNPLTAILGLARQLGKASDDPRKVVASAEMIHREAFGLDFQLQNICAAAELEAGEAAPDLARVEMAGLVAEVFDAFEHQAVSRDVDLRIVSPESLVVVSDARKLHLILSNLVANALEFSPVGEAVSVEIARRAGRLSMTVANAGGSIAPADRDIVFDRFRQLDEGTNKKHRGHGLGLSVTKSLVDMLGGEITLGGSDGSGFQVTVSFPEADADVDVLAQTGNLFLFGETERF